MDAPVASRSRLFGTSLNAVIAAAVCIQAAQGIFDICLPLRAENAGLSATAFGWTGAAHALGFLAGAFLAPAALRRLGAYRLLILACLLASPLGGLGWTSSEAIWLFIRVAGGFSFAVMFAATDTAVLDTAPVGARSRAIGIYVMFERLAMMIMPFAFAGRLAAPLTLVYGTACLWASLGPGQVLRRSHPPAARSGLKPWSTIHAAWSMAPAAVICAFAAGALNSSTLVLLPRWVHGALGQHAVPVVQAAAWGGALMVQLGVGFLARSKVRMHACTWLSPCAAAAFLLLPLAASAGLIAATLAGMLLGITAFSQYGLALMAIGETAARRTAPPPSSALVFAWGMGAVLGPMTCSAIGLFAHPDQLFAALGSAWLAVPLASLAAKLRRPALRGATNV